MGEKKLIILVFRQRLGKVPQCPNLSTCQQATRERQKRRALMCPWPSRSSSSRSEPPPATICTVVEVKREVWCMLTLCDTLQIRVLKKTLLQVFIVSASCFNRTRHSKGEPPEAHSAPLPIPDDSSEEPAAYC